jgi:predicted GTPase
MHFHPGETNIRMADVVVVNKVDSASPEQIAEVRANVAAMNSRAKVILARSALTLVGGDIAGKSVAVVEDGPTLTHGGMTYGAGVVAARRFGASELVDPVPFATGELAATLARYPGLEHLLPAMGYGQGQMHELETTLNAMPADLVLSATPIDLTRVLRLDKPVVRVRYELEELAGGGAAQSNLTELLAPIVERARAASASANHH